MDSNFSMSSSEMFGSENREISSEQQGITEELKREGVSAEEELFLDVDMLISTIANAWEMVHGIDQGDPDVREREKDGTFTAYGVIQQHHERFLRGWAELLYTAALTSSGALRLRYAKALDHLRLLVGCDTFELKTKGLHISAARICELVKKAGEETGPLTHGHLYRAFQ